MAKNWSKTPKNQKLWILVLPEVDFTKITKSWLFYCYFWRFWEIFGQATSGSSPKCDILEVWQKHVCLVHILICLWKTWPAGVYTNVLDDSLIRKVPKSFGPLLCKSQPDLNNQDPKIRFEKKNVRSWSTNILVGRLPKSKV